METHVGCTDLSKASLSDHLEQFERIDGQVLVLRSVIQLSKVSLSLWRQILTHLVGLEGHLHVNGAVSWRQLQPLVHRLLPSPRRISGGLVWNPRRRSQAHHRLQVGCKSYASETKIRITHVGVLVPLVGWSVGRDVPQVGRDADVRDTGHVARLKRNDETSISLRIDIDGFAGLG